MVGKWPRAVSLHLFLATLPYCFRQTKNPTLLKDRAPVCCIANLDKTLVYQHFCNDATDKQTSGNKQMSVLQNALELGDGQNGNTGKNQDRTGIFSQKGEKSFHYDDV